jgi:exosortase A-associated hydrolase 2
MSPRREAFFLGEAEQSRFCLVSRPAGDSRGVVIHVHAFAEELNRSRRMIALTARALVDAGWTVLQLDAHGCGDSAGDFADARWDSWLADLDLAVAWSQADPANAGRPQVLWSLRFGSLLASAWMCSRDRCLPLLAWQPVLQGAAYLTQFLRIRLGADLAQGGTDATQVLTQLREQLRRGQAVTIGGYELPGPLALALEACEFHLPAGHRAPVQLLELGTGDAPELMPATQRWLDRLRAQGHHCSGLAVPGPRFWQTVDIETAPALIAPTVHFVQEVAS